MVASNSGAKVNILSEIHFPGYIIIYIKAGAAGIFLCYLLRLNLYAILIPAKFLYKKITANIIAL